MALTKVAPIKSANMKFFKTLGIVVLAFASITAAYPVASANIGVEIRSGDHGLQPFPTQISRHGLTLLLGLNTISFKRDDQSEDPRLSTTFEERGQISERSNTDQCPMCTADGFVERAQPSGNHVAYG